MQVHVSRDLGEAVGAVKHQCMAPVFKERASVREEW